MKTGDEVIKGIWREGKLHGGLGERRKDDGEIYTCDNWVKGKMNGKGKHHNKEESYVGEFRDNMENGKGKLISHKDEFNYEG